MAAAKQRSPQQLYHGATSCDFAPAWTIADSTAASLAIYAHDTYPADISPWGILADRMEEAGIAGYERLRVALGLFAEAPRVRPAKEAASYDSLQAAFDPLCQTEEGWWRVRLFGCLLSVHAPSGYRGKRQWQTLVDARVFAVQRWCWCDLFGLVDRRQADAARSQANAAWRQANEAWSQANAAWSQADAAMSQADAAWRQADAAWSQAYAARSQADAAWRQADAAWRQAADKVWRYAQSLWAIVAEAKT